MTNENMMEFPETWEEYEQQYGFDDTDEVYTNGSRLIQSFRVKQWLDHLSVPDREKGTWKMDDGTNAVCPVCNKLNGARGDFCKWCGSDMRGKANE